MSMNKKILLALGIASVGLVLLGFLQWLPTSGERISQADYIATSDVLKAAHAATKAAATPRPVSKQQVTLKSHNSFVNMFFKPFNEYGGTDFPVGTKCTLLGQEMYSEAGSSFLLKKLNCNGTIGYVNAQYVR